VIVDFYNQGTEDVYNGVNSRQARKTLPVELRGIALRKIYFLENAVDLKDLRMPPGNRLEVLRGERQEQYAIRINDRYRICFLWSEKGPKRVEIVDYH
jgi:proteic killer suppression protein